MKKVLCVLLFFCAYVCFSQSSKENIKSDFNTYMHLTINKEFDKSIEYVVEDFFEIIPKEQMIKAFEQIYNNPKIEFKIGNSKIISIGVIEKIEEKYYAIIRYLSPMEMKIKPDNPKESAKEKEERLNMIEAAFARQFGAKNVTYNKETDFFEVTATKQACSVSKNGQNDWKFVMLDKRRRYILEKFLPKKILDQI